jgi:hypothetical protein
MTFFCSTLEHSMINSSDDQERASEWIKYWNEIFDSNPDAANSAEAAFCPPEPSPEERPADEDPEFLASCRADVISMANGPVVWAGQRFTRSPKWGLVWRADFWEAKENNQSYPSRVTCWKSDTGECGMTISGLQHNPLEFP